MGLIRAQLAAHAVVGGAVLVCLILAAPASASASCSTTCTWTGQTSGGGFPPTAASTDWSNASNWDPNGVPDGTVASPDASIVFGDLSGYSSCTSAPPADACYESVNNLPGIATDSLQVDDAHSYVISGNGISIGAGGITASSSLSSPEGYPNVELPLMLTASQTWSISGPSGGNGGIVGLSGNVTGPTSAVTVSVDDGALDLANCGSGADDEVGAVSFSTPANIPGELGLGCAGHGTSLNGTDGNPVSFTGDSALAVGGASRIGPLSMSGGTIFLGNASHVATLSVNGGAAFDSGSSLNTYITDTTSSPVAGTDYSQLGAIGNANLGGSSLTINAGTSDYTDTCLALPVGTVYTLVTAGSLTGTFSNAPSSGDDVQAFCNGGVSTPATFQINYNTSTSPATVTATVVNPTTTTSTTLSASPGSPSTNQRVTLTANVSPAPASPSGTVDFTDNGNEISGCTAQPVDANTGDASCQTAFTAGTQNLTATYNPAGGSSYAGSSGSDALAVGRDSTSTTLSASNRSPNEGQSVTYTATVTPADSGSTEASGTVEFTDGGSPISGCASQPLTAGGSSSSAACTTRYSSAGSHSITASYGGDANFMGSTSSTQAVNVTAPPTPPHPPNPRPRASLSLLVSPGHVRAGVRACFEFIARSRGRAITGVLVRFAGHSALTAARGRVRICMALRSGTYRPTASKRSFKAGRATVSVHPPPTPPRFTG